MPESSTIERDWHQNTEALLSFVVDLEEDLTTQKPDSMAWSIVESMEHLLALEQALGFVFRGRKQQPDRDPEMLIGRIRKVFADDVQKFRAGGPVLPQGQFQSKQEVVTAFAENREQLLRFAREAGWTNLCLDFNHALFGRLTVTEWIYFCIYHAARHQRQMERNAIRLQSQN